MTRCRAFSALVAALGLMPAALGASERGSTRAHLGVTLEEVGKDGVSRLGLAAERGAIVKEVTPGTPAAKAGLEAGDVIVGFQGETVQSAAQLRRLVAETPPGRAVDIEVRRGGADTRLRATLGERVGSRAGELSDLDVEALAGKARALARRHGFLESRPPRLGITFQEISGQLARYFKVPGGDGILVSSVEEGGPAEAAGIRAGDVILELGGRRVPDAETLREEVARAEAGETLHVTVQRDGKTLELAVKSRGAGSKSAPPSS